jgi:hypothetical protein
VYEAVNTSDSSLRVRFGRRAPWEFASEPERSLGTSSLDNLLLHLAAFTFLDASHAARFVACHGVRSHAVPVALVGECSMPVV